MLYSDARAASHRAKWRSPVDRRLNLKAKQQFVSAEHGQFGGSNIEPGLEAFAV
jgi:hypothetical protein